MREILILFCLFRTITLQANVEELPMFSLSCNLRYADIIVQAEILDDKGNLKIEKSFKGELVNHMIINLKEFAIKANERKKKGFPKEVGREIILFIDSSQSELNPSFWSWDLSTLWIEGNKYKGVFQPTNPGGYELYTFYKNETELKLRIDNWMFLEKLILDFNKEESSENRINRLVTLFNWHPFKEDILEKLFEEEDIEPKIILELIWKIFDKKYLSKSDLYPCGWRDFEQPNYYQLTFRLYKKNDIKGYEKAMQKILISYKSHIDYMEWKESSDINESFILEFTKFINENPIKNWDQVKLEINKIINKNEKFYNRQFLVELRDRIK